ncbi:uncharacterized protein LOC106011169 [Aplysia californica]|uniref:Uncharacterized protein LOC106011169 n=1 Tax=Aplysia californica TaxID=6500 RepID=A0ABM0ZVD7_APLCA|nr:uncharacterized protein LOC106011169 [Aplysia californica]
MPQPRSLAHKHSSFVPSSSSSSPQRRPAHVATPTSVLLAVSLVLSLCPWSVCGFPRERRQYFTSCWGWGASCSLHPAGRGQPPPLAISRPIQRQQPSPVQQEQQQPISKARTRAGIPSIVTSGGWGAGTMGKRAVDLEFESRGLLEVLRRLARRELDTY